MSRCVDAEFQRGAGGLRLNLNPGGAFLAHLTHSTRKGFKQTKTARRRSGHREVISTSAWAQAANGPT